jgi:hypothetical protein
MSNISVIIRNLSSYTRYLIVVFVIQFSASIGICQKSITFGPEANMVWCNTTGGFVHTRHDLDDSKNITGALSADFDLNKKLGFGFTLQRGNSVLQIGRPNVFWSGFYHNWLYDTTAVTQYDRKVWNFAPFFSFRPIKELRFRLGPYFQVVSENELMARFYASQYYISTNGENDYLLYENNFKRLESGIRLSLAWEIPIAEYYRVNLTGSYSRSFDVRKDEWMNAYNTVYRDSDQTVRFPIESLPLHLRYWMFTIGVSRVISFEKEEPKSE